MREQQPTRPQPRRLLLSNTTKQLWPSCSLSDSPNKGTKPQEGTITVKMAQITVNRIGNYLLSLFNVPAVVGDDGVGVDIDEEFVAN